MITSKVTNKKTLGILWIFMYFGNLMNPPFLHKLDDFMYVEENTYNEGKHKTQHLLYIQFHSPVHLSKLQNKLS